MHLNANLHDFILQEMKTRHVALVGLDVEPGFLSVDTDGRVIRVDSFSKVMAPGLRLAWVTATPKTIVHCLNASFGPTLGPAPLSQGVAYSLLQSWGFQGFEFYIKRLQVQFRSFERCVSVRMR